MTIINNLVYFLATCILFSYERVYFIYIYIKKNKILFFNECICIYEYLYMKFADCSKGAPQSLLCSLKWFLKEEEVFTNKSKV